MSVDEIAKCLAAANHVEVNRSWICRRQMTASDRKQPIDLSEYPFRKTVEFL